MRDPNLPLASLRDEVLAHVTTEALCDYYDGALSEADAIYVVEHLDICAECATLSSRYRAGLTSSTGFDPITRERYRLDASWEVSAIPAFMPLRAADFGLQAAAASVAGHQDFEQSGIEVKIAIVNNQVRAIVRKGDQPIVDAEVRLELRGEALDSTDFDLYACGTTDADGLADLGSYRRFRSFPNGHRFVLGVVLPGQ